MKIKLIASDLDGTLLTDKKEILEETRAAIALAVKQGIYFVPATGRAFDSIPKDVLNLPGVEYVITSNGAAVYSMKEGRRIYERLLSAESVEKILEFSIGEQAARQEFEGNTELAAQAVPVAYEVFINGVPYADAKYVADPQAYGANEHGAKYVKNTRRPVEDMRTFICEHRSELDSIDFVCGDTKEKARIKAWLGEHVADIFVTSSVPQLLEIGHKDAGKGQTLHWLLDFLGVSPEEAMCFGDADNDIDMLQAVQYGVAMSNGTDSCKAAAWAVTGSNESDGVGTMIRQAAAWKCNG